MSLGERILQLRKASGLSQEQFGEVLNVSRQAISKWETDQSVPDIDKLLAISQAYSISMDELLDNEVASGATASSQQLKEVTKANMTKRKFTIGWITTISGLVMLMIELFSLQYMQRIEREMYHQWNINIFHYAKEQPMPIVFTITLIIVALGIVMLISTLGNKGKKSLNSKD